MEVIIDVQSVLQLTMTLKFSRNVKVTRSLIGRRPVRPLANDEFERMTLIRQILLEILNNENIRPKYLRC